MVNYNETYILVVWNHQCAILVGVQPVRSHLAYLCLYERSNFKLLAETCGKLSVKIVNMRTPSEVARVFREHYITKLILFRNQSEPQFLYYFLVSDTTHSYLALPFAYSKFTIHTIKSIFIEMLKWGY